MQAVGAEAIVDNVFSLDPAPLGLERPAERRMVGFCYHFALLHCALLRATGTPARIRCGFAGYFEAQRWTDHWVVEYWDGDRHRVEPVPRRCFAAGLARQRRTVGLGRIARQPDQ